jgi:predicted PurR-regulated permease PerM
MPDGPRLDMRPASLIRFGVFFGVGWTLTQLGLQAVIAARDVLVRALVAVFIAVSLDPAVRWLARRGMRRGQAVAIIFLLALGLVVGFLVSVIPQLVSEFRGLLDDLPGYVTRLQARSAQFRDLNSRFHLTDQLQSLARTLPAKVGTGLLGFTGLLFGAVFSTLTVLVLTIYFMADLPRLEHGLVRLFPVERRARSQQVVEVVVDKVGGYMIGNILISIVAGFASFVAFEALRVPFPVPLAFLVALFDLIPMVGATLGAVMGVVVTLFAKGVWPAAVVMAIFFLVYQQVENYLIAPRILRSTVDLGAAAVLMAGLIGATALGLIGALMAIPVAAAMRVLLDEQLAARERAAGIHPPGVPVVPGAGGATPDHPPEEAGATGGPAGEVTGPGPGPPG